MKRIIIGLMLITSVSSFAESVLEIDQNDLAMKNGEVVQIYSDNSSKVKNIICDGKNLVPIKSTVITHRKIYGGSFYEIETNLSRCKYHSLDRRSESCSAGKNLFIDDVITSCSTLTVILNN